MDNNENNEIVTAYEDFLAASDLAPTLKSFYKLCEILDINPKNHKTVFTLLKAKLKLWKCQTLFSKLEKRSKLKDYNHKPCAKLKVLVIGAGPIGLRSAIEAAFLGANVVVVEKRNSFSRNNVLHLWPFLIVDLKALGVKSFFGKFCAGSLDHISIRRLQCILLKMGLLLGVQVHCPAMVVDIVEPADGKGWRINFKPNTPQLQALEFDAIIGCDGKNNCLKFKRKEFRGKLAIAITCNFVNKKTSEEARVEEISGVAFIYNQEFFHQLNERTGIELENIVYYKDETHYFVMTAKKKSLLNKGVIKQDSKDVFKLLSAENVNHKRLCDFARESADFSTKYQLPHHEFAVNHYGKEDVALFDFTSIHQAENASRIIERKGKRLLMCIAGDLLLEPFWPTGSGCARGFLGAMDAAWMLRGFGNGRDPIDLIQERESIFTILPQTKPDSLMQDFDKYSINPSTRYCNLNTQILTKKQAKTFYDCSQTPVSLETICLKSLPSDSSKPIEVKKAEVDPDTLLKWCKEQTTGFPNVNVTNMSTSWRNGLAFCAIICRYQPDLIDYSSLDPYDAEGNCKKAFSAADEFLGIPPKMSSHDFAAQRVPDSLAVMAYVSLYYELLKNETPQPVTNVSLNGPVVNGNHEGDETIPGSPKMRKIASKMTIISRLSRQNKKNKKKSIKGLKTRKKDKHLPEKEAPIADSSEKSINHVGHTGMKNDDGFMVNGDHGVSGKRYENNKSPRTVNSRENQEDLLSKEVRAGLKSTGLLLNGEIQPASQNRETKSSELQNGVVKDDPTNKYNRISQLAESVFGDTIVQQSPRKVHKESPPKETKGENLAESERCYFCRRKVFIMERQSAEGLFFHRKCFRCIVCKCQLQLGNYAYHTDDEEPSKDGKFFCKLHYNKMIYKNVGTKKTADILLPEKRRPYSVQIAGLPTESESEQLIKTPPKPTVNGIHHKLRGNPSQLDPPTRESADRKYRSDGFKSPYDKLTARKLDRHPSLLKCGARKVVTKSFFTPNKLSISTPNLSKLIQEDSMFEKEREEILNQRNSSSIDEDEEVNDSYYLPRSLSSLGSNKELSDLFPGDDHVGMLRHSPSMEYVSRNSFGAVERRPMAERRAQYPVSMAFSDGIMATNFRPVSVEISVDDESSYTTDNTEISCNMENTETLADEEIKQKNLPAPELSVDSSSSSEEEEPPISHKKPGVKGKGKKVKLTPKERELQAAKEKRREERKIKKEMKAREIKRLWEAQSIQRKLDEVDVQQNELEKLAKEVEQDLRNERNSPERINELTFEWFKLVNEKNMLLRFESELVIQSNDIQLEDRKARLEQQIRVLMSDGYKRSRQKEIDQLIKELVDTVMQRDALVVMMEQDRIRELEEDECLKITFSKKAHDLGMDRLI